MERSFSASRPAEPEPRVTAAAASTAASKSRRFRGGGKYSSSSMTVTSCVPWAGASRSITSHTRCSGAEAPAVTPMVPERSSGTSLASLMRSTRRQPASAANSTRDMVFDELAEPITSTASHSGAISIIAVWRLVVAKHRSLMLGCHRSGKRRLVCSSTPSHSRCESVV